MAYMKNGGGSVGPEKGGYKKSEGGKTESGGGKDYSVEQTSKGSKLPKE